MKEDGEIEDDLPSGEEGAEQEPRSEATYDPLIEPWNDAASASLVEYRLSQSAVHDAARFGARPLYGAPQPAIDELTGLRERLRAETVVVPKRQHAWSVTVREVVETLLLALLIFLAVRASMQNFRVEGASMEPSLQDNEFLIVNKLSYATIDLGIFDWLPFFDAGDDPVHHLWASPRRGDIIVFHAPTNPSKEFIKRIIGVPGDLIEIDGETGTTIVNGRALDEPYTRGETSCRSSCGPWVVPERSYFVMGDNRRNSSDSRQGWFVPEENIVGKALITYWHDGSPDLDLAPNRDVSFIGEAAAEE